MKQVYVLDQGLVNADGGLLAAKGRLSPQDYANAKSISIKAGAIADRARVAAKTGQPVQVYIDAANCLILQVGAYYGKNPMPASCPEVQ